MILAGRGEVYYAMDAGSTFAVFRGLDTGERKPEGARKKAGMQSRVKIRATEREGEREKRTIAECGPAIIS